jgi:hypothetical protein
VWDLWNRFLGALTPPEAVALESAMIFACWAVPMWTLQLALEASWRRAPSLRVWKFVERD